MRATRRQRVMQNRASRMRAAPPSPDGQAQRTGPPQKPPMNKPGAAGRRAESAACEGLGGVSAQVYGSGMPKLAAESARHRVVADLSMAGYGTLPARLAGNWTQDRMPPTLPQQGRHPWRPQVPDHVPVASRHRPRVRPPSRTPALAPQCASRSARRCPSPSRRTSGSGTGQGLGRNSHRASATSHQGDPQEPPGPLPGRRRHVELAAGKSSTWAWDPAVERTL